MVFHTKQTINWFLLADTVQSQASQQNEAHSYFLWSHCRNGTSNLWLGKKANRWISQTVNVYLSISPFHYRARQVIREYKSLPRPDVSFQMTCQSLGTPNELFLTDQRMAEVIIIVTVLTLISVWQIFNMQDVETENKWEGYYHIIIKQGKKLLRQRRSSGLWGIIWAGSLDSTLHRLHVLWWLHVRLVCYCYSS